MRQKNKTKKNQTLVLISLHFTFTFCFATFAYYFSLYTSLPSVRCAGIMLFFTFLRGILFMMIYTFAS